ncbi:MAG: phosphoglycerate dehydrogenase, partial [Vallitaleaceae bacterium]|nr:phosphoglycerate dehydrogenase [Vallitaleaceae bacterium]
CAKEGIVVFNTPGANANAVKELVLAGLLMSSRDVTAAIDWAKTLRGEEQVAKKVEAGKAAFTGPEIMGKTLGIVGLGAIGALVANAAISLGMEVYGFDPFISVDAAWGLKSAVNKAKSLEELVSKSDYISVHVPLMDATRGMINTELITKMKDDVRILNFSRAELVDDDSIEAALASKKVAKYVTDFPNERTVAMEGVIAIPHLGASTPESETNCAKMAVKQMMDYLEFGNIVNSVNYPDASLGGLDAVSRVCVLHKNVPNMVGQITSTLAAHNMNIQDMLNKSKKEYAYTMIDLESEVTDAVASELTKIDGVLKVRILKA